MPISLFSYISMHTSYRALNVRKTVFGYSPGRSNMTNRSTSSNRAKLLKLTQVGILTAIVVVLQLVGAFIKFGPFSVSLVLVPIVIGAILCGPLTGAWLGLVFGAVVLLSGDAAAFYALSPAGTIFLVLFKGTMAGLCSGLVYKALSNWHKYPAVLLSAIVCPVVNTGIFLIGCLTIFRPYLQNFSEAKITDPFIFVVTVFIGLNFVFELVLNVVLAPVIVRLTDMGRSYFKKRK